MCSVHCSKVTAVIILIFFNTVFVLLSVGLIIGVTYMRGEAEEKLVDVLPTRKAFGTSIAYNFQEVGTFVSQWIIYATMFATMLLILGLLGWVACYSLQTCLLFTYIFFLSALFVMVSGFVSYYFNTELDKWLRWTAMDIIRNRYRGRYSFEWPSLVINYMMAKGFCCGVKSFRDFEKAKRWKRMYKVDGKTRKLPIPLSCCRVDDHFPRGIPRDVECTKTPTKTNSFIQDGCSRWIGDVASEYEGTVKYWTIGILLLLIFLIILAIFVVVIQQKDYHRKQQEELEKIRDDPLAWIRAKLRDIELIVG